MGGGISIRTSSGHPDEAKRFKVKISIGDGSRKSEVGSRKVYPIDMRKTDILKEKNGALIFGAGGTAEEFFQDVERRNGEKMKTILLTCEIIENVENSGPSI